MIEHKRILILAKETFSYPLYFLSQRWMENNEVACFYFMAPECKYAECLLNTTTYYAFGRLKNVKMYDVCDIADEFTRNVNHPVVDYDYLERLEEEYTHFKNLNIQLMSSQFTTRQYHFRNYMKPFTHEQQMYWLQLNYKKVFEVLDDFRPDVIIDYDDAELPRSIINEVAYRRGIPYITIDHPRYEDYKLYTFQMGIGVEDYFRKAYAQQLQKNDDELTDEYQYIDEFRKKSSIMPDEYKNTITAKYDRDSWLTIAKVLFGKILYFREQDKAGQNKRLKKKNPLIYPSSWEYIKFYFRTELLKRKLYGKNRYFENPVEGEKYVYMPLHLIPESTTFVKAPMYVNELNIIEAISKALPIDWKLYVKEHQAMLGERETGFYEAVKKLPNVRLVSINYYKDPKPWIAKSQGVVTITGTGAYEAAILGKKSLIFGDVSFKMIEGIQRVKSFEELPHLLRKINTPADNRKSCAAYIAAIKQVGKSIKYKYLMAEGEDILFGRSKISNTYVAELDKLEKFYEEAYEHFKALKEEH